jgi:hypothetical protein
MSSNTTDWGVDINDPVINAESHTPAMAGVLISCAVLEVIFVSLRMFTRVHLLRKPGADDVTIVIAEVFALATIFVTGMGKEVILLMQLYHLTLSAADTTYRGSIWTGSTHLDYLARGYGPPDEGKLNSAG